MPAAHAAITLLMQLQMLSLCFSSGIALHQLLSVRSVHHSCGLLCRDLKLENILLTASGDVKLSDFGLGAVREAAAQSRLLHTVSGHAALKLLGLWVASHDKAQDHGGDPACVQTVL